MYFSQVFVRVDVFSLFCRFTNKSHFWRQVLSMKTESVTLWLNSKNICEFFVYLLHFKSHIFERAFQQCITSVILISTNERDMPFWKSMREIHRNWGTAALLFSVAAPRISPNLKIAALRWYFETFTWSTMKKPQNTLKKPNPILSRLLKRMKLI